MTTEVTTVAAALDRLIMHLQAMEAAERARTRALREELARMADASLVHSGILADIQRNLGADR